MSPHGGTQSYKYHLEWQKEIENELYVHQLPCIAGTTLWGRPVSSPGLFMFPSENEKSMERMDVQYQLLNMRAPLLLDLS